MTRSLDQALLQGADVSAMAASNLLVNSFHTVSQESGDTALSGAGTSQGYTTDQWITKRDGTMATVSQRVANPFPTAPGIPYGLRLRVTTAQPAMAATNTMSIQQYIEGTRVARLGLGSAKASGFTVAMMLRSNINLLAYLSISNAAFSRSYLKKIAALANTDTFITYYVPPETSGVWTSDTAAAMAVRLFLASGSTFSTGTEGVWNNFSPTGAADIGNLAATINNEVIVSGLVIIPGRVEITQDMLPLLARSNVDERFLCQRYFQKRSIRGPVTPNTSTTNGYAIGSFSHAVPMRAAPSVTFTDANGVNPNRFTIGNTGDNVAAAAGSIIPDDERLNVDFLFAASYYSWWQILVTSNARI